MFEKLKDKLVDDVHEWYKWASTWFFLSIPVITALQENVPIVEDYLPRWVVAVIAFLGFIARVYRQSNLNKEK